MKRYHDPPAHQARRRYLIDHLPERGRFDPRVRLRNKLIRCEDPNRRACGSPTCPKCTSRYIGRQRKKLQNRYHNVPNGHLAFLTIVLGVTRPNEVEEITDIWDKAKRDLRNVVDRRRRKSPSWEAVELTLWLEVDAVDVQGIACLGSDKKRQISE